mmetsp:Transcript_85118/g.150544  ORF Transcript_85118/g.150544 Transcript_85118/m.150544 type:complete len:941 (+) Transcript_85118:112-2934(+)
METANLLESNNMQTKEEMRGIHNGIWSATHRGHIGMVNCVCPSMELDYIVSGGQDGSTRIWRFDEEYASYNLRQIIQHGVGENIFDDEAARATPVVRRSAASVNLGGADEDYPRIGVTAVCTTGSRRQITVNEMVQVDEDEEFIKSELDYIETIEWKDEWAKILGQTMKVTAVSVLQDTVTLSGHDGETFLTAELPMCCVTREESKEISRDGPTISGTADGDVSVLCTCSPDDSAVRLFSRLHEGAVNDICAIPCTSELLEIVVVSVSDDGDAAVLTLLTEEDTQEGLGLCLRLTSAEVRRDKDGRPIRMRHQGSDGRTQPVLQVRPIGTELDDHDRASFATLTQDGVNLWSGDGAFLMKLTIHPKSLVFDPSQNADVLTDTQVDRYRSLATVSKESGTLLFAAGQDIVGVWFMDDGMVTKTASLDKTERIELWQRDLQRYQQKGLGIKPTAVYQQWGQALDVDQSGASASFAIDLRHEYTTTMWQLEGISSLFLAVEPSSLANQLIMPGRERILLEMTHTSRPISLRVAYDPDYSQGAGGPALIVGCEDGTVSAWDLEGDDSGQKYAEMRSLSRTELWLPLFMLMVSSLQLLSFAFGPAVPWNQEVKSSAVYVRKVAVLDFEWKYSKEDIFWPKTQVVMVLMTFFILYQFLGVQQNSQNLFRFIQNAAPYKLERKRAPCCRPLHALLVFLKWLFQLQSTVISLLATILVVPMVKVIAIAFDCVPADPDNAQLCILGGCRLAEAPTILCYESQHLSLIVKLGLLFPIYLFAVLPIAACAGDDTYVPPATLYNLDAWRRSAKRKATDLHMGYLHPNPKVVFRYQLMELLGRVAIPIITTETTRYPLLQTSLVASISFVSFVLTVVWHPFLEKKYLMLVIILKAYTVMVMLIGVVTVIIDDSDSWVPEILVACTSACAIIALMVLMMTVQLRTVEVGVYRAV